MALIDQALQTRYEFAQEIAHEAGKRALQYFGDASLHVERKLDLSPVTRADREAERFLRDRIESTFPDDSITGEEFGVANRPGTFHWILDPIDGTKSFVTGVPLFGTLVAVQHGPDLVIGVIELPALHEAVYALLGTGAWHRRADGPCVPAHVSQCRLLTEAVFLTSERSLFDARGSEHVYRRLESVCRITRTWGDCYGYALVATGRADVMVDPAMQVWDAAAVVPIIAEAGGSFSAWDGECRADGGDAIATANESLLRDVLGIINSTENR
jgi:histidinol phosphatase-like enzyme (inositol monophosphatase family)